MDVLERLEFENAEFKKNRLDMELDFEGANLSQREKQLICFVELPSGRKIWYFWTMPLPVLTSRLNRLSKG